jgi:hypothetical protein
MGQHGPAPNFCANPTVSSVGNGSWSDPAVWSTGRVPGRGDRVRVAGRTHVIYDVTADAPLDCVAIEPRASLDFRTDVATRMHVGTLLVLAGGALRVGTPQSPVQPGVTAEVVIADRPLDLTDDGRGVFDPEQLGTGVIAWGSVTMCGSARRPTFVRLAREARAGDTVLELAEAPAGWRPGDRLVLPESRQDVAGGVPFDALHWETPEVGRVEATRLELWAPLRHDHPGARDASGALRFLPHVAVLTRNVVIRSAAPRGTRGHVMMTDRAAVDIRYVQFRDLGRALNSKQVDVAKFDKQGRLESVARNQIGRYPLHMHHLLGPVRRPENGFQFTLIGNAVDGGDEPHDHRWGVVVHASHFGLVRDNVVYNTLGTGVTTEDGSEYGNIIRHNFTARTDGLGLTDYGRIAGSTPADFGHAGDGFWFSGPSNLVEDNVAAGSREAGFNYHASEFMAGSYNVPYRQGADPKAAGRSRAVHQIDMPFHGFNNNEAYAVAGSGLRVRFTNGLTGPVTIAGTRVWNSREGFLGERVPAATLDGFVVVGDASRTGAWLPWPYTSTRGLWMGPYAEGVTVRGAAIENVGVGVVAPSHTAFNPGYLVDTALRTGRPLPSPGGDFTIEGATLRNNRTDVRVENEPTGLVTYDDRRVVIRDTSFSRSAGADSLAVDASLKVEPWWGNFWDLRRRQRVFVYGFDRVAGDDFQVFFPEQAPGFVMPQSAANLIGSPAAGLTNRENWDRYGIAVGGQVAPDDAATRPGVRGLVAPIRPSPKRPAAPPVISKVRLVPGSGGRVTLTWHTDTPTAARVISGGAWVLEDGYSLTRLTTEHRATVAGASPMDRSGLVIVAQDAAGNFGRSDAWEGRSPRADGFDRAKAAARGRGPAGLGR